jgi:hypothetical protein
VKKRIGPFALVLTLILIAGVDAWSHESGIWEHPLSSHDIILEGLSWIAYDIECQKGDEISGSFDVTCDGSLYIGDEQKYDDWSLEGIQFLILDESNYSLFIESEAFETAFITNDVVSLSWTFEVPRDGTWFIIYDNNTIYLMNIVGSFGLVGESSILMIIVLFVLGGLGSLGIAFMIKRK